MTTLSTAVSELDRVNEIAAREHLPETDGEPLETPWHRSAINLLIDSVSCHRQGHTNYFVGGNMFIYYSRRQAREQKYRGPDFFFVKDVDGTRERLYWWVYEEDGKYPNVIIELLSLTTAEVDRTVKKPETRTLEGWRLNGESHYQAIVPDERGWLWSAQLELWLGTWEGTYLQQRAVWLRFYTPQGELVLTEAESERQRAESERQRAEGLAAQVERLQALLKEKRVTPESAE